MTCTRKLRKNLDLSSRPNMHFCCCRFRSYMPFYAPRMMLLAREEYAGSQDIEGSKEKQLLEKGLDQNPAYGFFHDLKQEQIMEKIDSLIDRRYIRTAWEGKLPILEFTPLGWAVERERRAKEFLQEWDHWIETGITPMEVAEWQTLLVQRTKISDCSFRTTDFPRLPGMRTPVYLR